MQIDTPLDDLVKKARRRQSQAKRGGRKAGAPSKGGVGPTRNARGEVAAQAARAAKKGSGSAGGLDPSKFPAQTGQGKIVISNLPEDVTEAQIRVGFCAETTNFVAQGVLNLLFSSQDLFNTTIGKVQSVSLVYNARGKSTGVSNVTFAKYADAQKAYAQYNGRVIDKRRCRFPPFSSSDIDFLFCFLFF
jgi:THO complex subunit 4